MKNKSSSGPPTYYGNCCFYTQCLFLKCRFRNYLPWTFPKGRDISFNEWQQLIIMRNRNFSIENFFLHLHLRKLSRVNNPQIYFSWRNQYFLAPSAVFDIHRSSETIHMRSSTSRTKLSLSFRHHARKFRRRLSSIFDSKSLLRQILCNSALVTVQELRLAIYPVIIPCNGMNSSCNYVFGCVIKFCFIFIVFFLFLHISFYNIIYYLYD